MWRASSRRSCRGSSSAPVEPRTEGRGLALGNLELARVGKRGRSTRGAGCGHRRAVHPDRVVDAADDQVAGRGAAKRCTDRERFVEDLLRLQGARGATAKASDTLEDVARRLARRTAAKIL